MTRRPASLLAILGVALTIAPAASAANLQARLATGESATAILQQWCAARRPAEPAVITAERDPRVSKPPGGEARRLLRARRDEAIRYRHVRLKCGARVLSEADNWYLPSRLTPEMNQRLDATDAPFGAVVAPLGFHRRILASEFISARAGTGHVLRVEALLITAAGAPFSVVVETYAAELTNPGR